jgi:hypothetical protein
VPAGGITNTDLAGQDSQMNSPTFSMLTRKIFGNRINGATLLANSMGESYGFFYAGDERCADHEKQRDVQCYQTGDSGLCGAFI